MKSKINFNETNIKKIFSRVLKISLNEIKNNLSRENCKNWDSMNHVRLVLEIEKELGIWNPLPPLFFVVVIDARVIR